MNKWRKRWLIALFINIVFCLLYWFFPNTAFGLLRFVSFGVVMFTAGASWVEIDEKEKREKAKI